MSNRNRWHNTTTSRPYGRHLGGSTPPNHHHHPQFSLPITRPPSSLNSSAFYSISPKLLSLSSLKLSRLSLNSSELSAPSFLPNTTINTCVLLLLPTLNTNISPYFLKLNTAPHSPNSRPKLRQIHGDEKKKRPKPSHLQPFRLLFGKRVSSSSSSSPFLKILNHAYSFVFLTFVWNETGQLEEIS